MLGISLGMGMRPGRGSSVPSYDPVVQAWLTAGAEPGEGIVDPLNTLILSMRSNAYFDDFSNLLVFVGGDIDAGPLIPLIGAESPVKGGGLSNTHYTEGGGITGNGTVYVDLGWVPAFPTGGFGCYSRGSWGSAAAGRILMGVADAGADSNLYYLRQTTTPSYQAAYGGLGQTDAVAGLAPSGCYHVNRYSNVDCKMFLNGVQAATRTANTTVASPDGRTMYLLANYSGGGTPLSHSVSSVDAAWKANLSAAKVALWNTDLTAFLTAIGTL